MKLKHLLVTAAIGLSAMGAAQANQTWAWSYAGVGVTASGTLTTAGQALSFEDILSVTGTRNGAPIIGLVPLDTDPDFGYDNQFRSVGEHFTDGGVVFDFAGALPNVNLYVLGGVYLDLFINNGSAVEVPVTFNVTAVPEPATVASMLAGLGLLAVYMRKARA